MLNAIVEGPFVFFVAWSRISLQTVNARRSGKKRTPLKVQICNGLLQTRNRVPNVSDKLRKTKDVII
jgi:hypothetical protein